jgi:membrane protease YdiL (CAAX protease family)
MRVESEARRTQAPSPRVSWRSLADSPIGLGPGATPRRSRAAAAIALGLLVVDLTGTRLGWWRPVIVLRLVPPALVVAVLIALGARAEHLGLRWPPLPSGRFWLRAAALLAGGLGLLLAIVFGVAALLDLPVVAFPAGYHGGIDYDRALDVIVLAPLFEETIWRLAMVPGLVAGTGRGWAIVIDGAGFAALHFVYGIPGPDNFVGGYIFAWVYLRSGSIALPLALHVGANLCAVFGQAAVWRLLHG